MVMWRSVSGNAGREVFDRWVAAYKDDTSSDPQRVKVLRAKPADAVDGCFDKATPARFIAEPLPFTSEADVEVQRALPGVFQPAQGSRRTARREYHQMPAEGGRCEGLPCDVHAGRNERASAPIFPGGVCDWSKPGVNQTPVVTWASLGPSPKNLIFSVAPARDSSR